MTPEEFAEELVDVLEVMADATDADEATPLDGIIIEREDGASSLVVIFPSGTELQVDVRTLRSSTAAT